LSIAFGDKDAAPGAFDVTQQTFGIDALAIQQIGFGGPALLADLATVGGGHQRDEGGDVRGGRGTEGQRAHAPILRKTAPQL